MDDLRDQSDFAPRDSTESFVSQFARSEFELRSYILTLLPHWADADDVLQRTSIILWRKFGEWQPGTNFTAWACSIARFEVKNFLRTKERDRHYFTDELVESIGDTRAEMSVELADRRDALRACLQKLSPRDREVIDACYAHEPILAKDAAVKLGRQVNTVYKALIRIRRVLFECIERSLAAGGRS